MLALKTYAAALWLAASTVAPPPTIEPGDARLLIQAIGAAGSHGLKPADMKAVERLLASPDPAQRERGQAQLRAAAVDYARAQRGQRLEARKFHADWAMHPAPYAAERELDAALQGHRVAAWLAELPPPDPRYRRLVEAHERYSAIVEQGGWFSLQRTLKPGAKGPAVIALRHRLAIEDPLIAGEDHGAEVYDQALSEAVTRAEGRFGLNPDGVARKELIAALNVPADVRLGQIRANLERWRWVQRSLPPTRLEVNTAAAWLDAYEDGKVALAMRTIVGRRKDPTPSFQDQVEAIVFNPPWNVPPSIAEKELWPKERKTPGYFASQDIVIKPDGGLQQLAGPKSALGQVKLDLPNPFGVYLHDTPARTLFALESRYLSHGCMRLAQPIPLAKRLLAASPAWSESRIDSAVSSGETIRAPLARPVPVFVFHFTAFVDEQGQASFRPDVYGWDAKLLKHLREDPP